MTKKELLDRCARDGAERVLLAVCWTSWNWLRTGASQPIPPFSRRVNRPLSPIYSTPGGSPAISFGVAFPAQSGALCAFLPDWQDENDLLLDPEGPLAAIGGRLPSRFRVKPPGYSGLPYGPGVDEGKAGGTSCSLATGPVR